MQNLLRMLLGTLFVLAAASRTHAIQLNVQAGSDWDVTVTWSGVAGENLARRELPRVRVHFEQIDALPVALASFRAIH